MNVLYDRLAMKRVIFAYFVLIFSNQFAFAQQVEDHFNCGVYSKRIEYNLTMNGANLKSKSDIENLFFGGFNAMTEICYEPSSEVNPCIPSGFRIIRDSLNSSYILQVRHNMTNYDWLQYISFANKFLK